MSSYEEIRVGNSTVELLRLDGDENRPTVLMLHEGLGCVELWRDFPHRLNQQCSLPVVAYSRCGYGASAPISLPRPLDYMRVEAQNFLPELLTALKISKPIVLGHSDGATIALEFAAAFPSHLAALVILAPHIFVEDCSINAIRAADHEYQHGRLREKLQRYHHNNVDNAFRGWCDSWLHPAFKKWNMEEVLEHIEVPILQIQGLADEYGSDAHVRSIEQYAHTQVETVLFENCGHAPHFERKLETMAAISDFLARI